MEETCWDNGKKKKKTEIKKEEKSVGIFLK